MRLETKLLAGCLAFLVAGAILLAPLGHASDSGTCQRTLRIAPQAAAGEGSGTATFAVYSTGCAAAGSVQYTVEPGTARAGTDVVLVGGLLRWADGDAGHRSIAVPIVADTVAELEVKDFTVRLSTPSASVVVAGGVAEGLILDDDVPAQPIWAPTNSFCGGTTVVSPPPSLPPNTLPMPMPGVLCVPANATPSRPVPQPVTIKWSTVDGTARAGVDFVGVTDRVQTMPAGASAAPMEVQLLPVPPGTPTRWLSILITFVSVGRIVDASATVTLYGS